MSTRHRSPLKLPRFVRVLSLLACSLLGACASIAPGGRSQLTVPTEISSLYSSIDMNMRLATAPSIDKVCEGVQCRVDKGFEAQVARLGARLSVAAYEADPALKERIPAFNFVVAEKSDAGSTSDAQGTIVIYRGVRNPGADEPILAFLIAREMGHVIARHHDERSANTLVFSVVAQVLMPFTALTGGVAAVAGSVASALGTKMVNDDQGRYQNIEAEAIAHDLLRRQGWSNTEVAASLAAYTQGLGDGAWANGIKDSSNRIEKDQPSASAFLLAMNKLDAPNQRNLGSP